MYDETWVQIPVAPKYEMNHRGEVRNIKSGRFVNPWMPTDRSGDKQFYLRVETGGKTKTFHQSSLLFLTHGIVPRRKNHSRLHVPVIVSHGNERYYFDSCNQAAKFIAKREHYAVITVGIHLSDRREEIYGWRINYLR